MFKFNFDPEDAGPSGEADRAPPITELIACKEVCLPSTAAAEQIDTLAWDAIELTDNVVVLKGRVSDEDASEALQQEEMLHSDLIPGKYEGGFKLWEGGIDLARYLVNTLFLEPCSSPVRVLELGCGHGLPGVVSLLAGATVDFQDYNAEVLQILTAPTVRANWRANREDGDPPPAARYFSGDWGTLGVLLAQLELIGGYDVVLSTETIYTLEGMRRVFDCIKQALKKPSGVCYVGAKSFYFGVGGGVAAFTALVKGDGEMTCTVVSTLEDGRSNKREILEMKWK